VLGDLYRNERMGILNLLGIEAVSGEESVPACPGWTVGDVVRHLIGLNDNWLTASLEIYASPEWTNRQVEMFADTPPAGLAEQWERRSGALEAMLDNHEAHAHLPDSIATVVGTFPTSTFPPGVVVDVAQHGSDIRFALGLDPKPSEPTLTTANRILVSGLKGVWRSLKLPSLSIASADTNERFHLGAHEPNVTLRAPSYDLFRSFGGRRTRAQVAELAWSGHPEQIELLLDRVVVPFFATPEVRREPNSHG